MGTGRRLSQSCAADRPRRRRARISLHQHGTDVRRVLADHRRRGTPGLDRGEHGPRLGRRISAGLLIGFCSRGHRQHPVRGAVLVVTAITVDSLGGGIEPNWRIRCSSTARTTSMDNGSPRTARTPSRSLTQPPRRSWGRSRPGTQWMRTWPYAPPARRLLDGRRRRRPSAPAI